MTSLRMLAVASVSLGLIGCFSPSIADLNGNPHRYYQSKVKVVGQISRMQTIGGDMLLEVADAREKRVLVRGAAASDFEPTDWIKVTGLFVPEMKVGEQTIYDAVVAEEISKTSAPWFRDLF